MDIGATLRKRIAPELNHLYTTSPFPLADGSLDGGWYCREHAFHVFILARLFGVDSDIRRGDFIVSVSGFPQIHSLDITDDHMWCRVGSMLPVDLSLTLRYFDGLPQLQMPITKAGTNGSYRVDYTTKEVDPERCRDKSIVLIEREVVAVSPMELLRDPYRLLHPPNPADSMNWDARYGPEIYARITLHCLRVATGHAKTTRNRLSAADAPKWITDTYPNALDELTRLLQ
jgi:hypothetical protein